MKIIIAGGGKIGSTLTAQLSAEGHEITVIDRKAEVLENIMESYDVIAVQGNSASMDVLEQADVQEANLLIAATDTDEVNLLSCMTAHGMNPELHTIGRIRNPEYRRQAFEMRDVFALNMAINPERQAAHEIARLLKYPGFLKIDTFAKGNVEIVELRIDAKSPLNHAKLSSLSQIVHTKVLICAVSRNGECYMPDGNFTLQVGDLIFVTAATDHLSILLRNMGIIARKAKRVLIAGGGRISYYLVEELARTGMACTVIEQNPARCRELAALLPSAVIVEGDASSQDFLNSEGIDDSDALVTLTGLDELNIVIALYAHTRNVAQVVTKVSHAENNLLLDSLHVGSVISPKEMASNNIVRYVRAMQNKEGAAITIHSIAGGKAEAIEFLVDADTRHVGQPLREVKTRSDVLIVSVSRGDQTIIADGSTAYQEGDTLVVVTNRTSTIRSLNDIFED